MDESANLNSEYLTEHKVCATGRLVSMTHAELAQLVESCGGSFIRTPIRSGFILVVGDNGWPAEKDGSVNQVFDRARQLKAYGYPINFIAEDEFLERLGLRQTAGAIRGPHTLGDLARILNVSAVRLRRWLRLGLIKPLHTHFQLPYFEFHQVAFIKQLQELIDGGASLADIRRGIEQSQDLLPHGLSLYSQCANIERDGRVLLRLRDRLVDQTGQRYFEFDAAADGDPAIFAETVRGGIHDLCDEALSLEEEGRLQEAAETYARALELEPEHPTLHFDLGNVLFQLGKTQDSLTHFCQATDLDPQFAMAWHNLGSVLAQLSAWKESEAALRQALRLVPTYADSHFALAEVLRKMARPQEADAHQRAYYEHSKPSCLLATREHVLRVVHADAAERISS